jgi:hypothetical protein
MFSFLPKELIINILFYVDRKTIVNFTSTNIIYYNIRNDIHFLQDKYNLDANLWNEIYKNKHESYYNFWRKLSKSIDCTTLIKFFQCTCDGCVVPNEKLSKNIFGNVINFFDMLTKSPYWYCYCIYKINNWNSQCMFQYKRSTNKGLRCGNKSVHGKYFCHTCIIRPSDKLYNDNKLNNLLQQISVDLNNI